MLSRDLQFFTDADPFLCQQYLQAVLDCFGEDWLTEHDGKKRVQQVWNRWDNNATIELLTFGQALRRMREISPTWVKKRVNAIRDFDRHGDLFELRCCAFFASGGMNIIPAKEDNPGFDAVVKLPSGQKLFVSMKNHEMSNAEREFRRQSAALREKVRKVISTKSTTCYIVITSNRHLIASDWAELGKAVERLACEVLDAPKCIVISNEVSLLASRLLPIEGSTFSSTRFSDSFVCFCREHKNEHKRMLDYLEDARLNLKHAVEDAPDSTYVVFIKIHPNASLDELQGEARRLLDENSDPGCDGFVLYQPAFCRNLAQDTTTLIHYIRAIVRKPLAKGKDKLKLETPIGLISQKSPLYNLQISGKSFNVKDHLIYQRSDQYYEPLITADAKGAPQITFNVRHFADGMFSHCVVDETTMPSKLAATADQRLQSGLLRIEGGVLSGNFAPNDDLLLI